MKPLKCSDHPKYQAKRRPRTGCKICSLIWLRQEIHRKPKRKGAK